MDIIDALKWAQGGYPVRRKHWPAGWDYACLDGQYFLRSPDNGKGALTPADMDAEDWEVRK